MAIFYNLWVIFTLALFYLGPIDWPGRHSPVVFLVVGACLVMFNCGVWAGGKKTVSPGVTISVFERWPLLTFALVVANLALWEWSVRSMTGLSMLDPRSYSLDFAALYNNFQTTLKSMPPPDGISRILVVTKAIIFSVSLYVVCVQFRRNILVAMALLAPMAASGLLRATDKEFFDIAIICGVLLFFMYSARVFWWTATLLVVSALVFFSIRKLGRVPNLPVCIWNGELCRDPDGLLGRISPTLDLTVLMITTYVTHGYQALTMATSLPFEPNYGAAHFPMVKGTLCRVFGVLCDVGTYEQKLSASGWPIGSRWSSVYVTLANDLSWYFLPLYFFFIGVLYGFSKKLWEKRNDYMSMLTIILITIFFVYSSANMQLAISYDWFIVTLVAFSVQTLRLFLPAGRRADTASPATGIPPAAGDVAEQGPRVSSGAPSRDLSGAPRES